VFSRKPTAETHPLDEGITNLISEIAGEEAGSEEHTRAVQSLKTLMELRAADKAAAKPFPLSADQMAGIAANLLGIGLIMAFEKAHVLTTKSLAFVPKVSV
jgi:hypothetical protein